MNNRKEEKGIIGLICWALANKGETGVSKKYVDEQDDKILEIIQNLENDKANYTYKVIADDNVSQQDAREVLTFLDQYEGKIIEFLTNGENPSKCVATGRLMTDKSNNTYLITYNRDGSITQWNKDSFEKHLVEAKNLINEPIVDIDNLTVDIAGNPPVLYLVRNAKNKPENTSEDGTVFVMPHAINKQLFFYTDMDSGKQWVKTVNGTDGQHTFGTWIQLGGSQFPKDGKNGDSLISDGQGGVKWLKIETLPEGGKNGDFLTSDGQGGAKWSTVQNAESKEF